MAHPARLALGVFRSPVLWGLLATFGFYSLARSSGVDQALVARYLDAHWTLQVQVAACFVGLAALVIKACDILGQAKLLRSPVLGDVSEGGQPISDVRLLLARIAELPRAWQDSYLLSRFRAALAYIDRKQAIDGLEAELRELAKREAGRVQASYGLVRLLLWAIPLVGVLGMALQAPAAVAKLSAPPADPSVAAAAGLAVAFDGLALAMGLCLGLMVLYYLVERAESQLLRCVDEQAARELVGRFQDSGPAANPLVGAVRRMAETVVRATERLVVQQTELWKATVDAAHQQWSLVSASSGKQLESTLTTALDRSLGAHAARLASQEQGAADQQRVHWEQVQQALIRTAETVASAQRELARQNDALGRVADSTAQLEHLENALNRNLNTLAGSSHFEETVMSLSAAIHLITGRMAQDPADPAARRAGQAA